MSRNVGGLIISDNKEIIHNFENFIQGGKRTFHSLLKSLYQYDIRFSVFYLPYFLHTKFPVGVRENLLIFVLN